MIEEENASARERRKENELKELNEIYRNGSEEPETQNVAAMIKQGVKHKPGAAPPEKMFEPFTSPFTEGIIEQQVVGEGEENSDSLNDAPQILSQDELDERELDDTNFNFGQGRD